MRCCQLSPRQAEALELYGVKPDCQHHPHEDYRKVDTLVGRGEARWAISLGGNPIERKRFCLVGKRVWVVAGHGARTWQLRDSYGRSARHFGQTQNKNNNLAHTRRGPVRTPTATSQ